MTGSSELTADTHDRVTAALDAALPPGDVGDVEIGGADRTVPPADARRLRTMLPGLRIIPLPGLGHLAHEEAPAQVAGLIEGIAAEAGVLAFA